MRFAVIEDKLVPAPLLTGDVPTFPISSIDHFREKLPLNPNFIPNPDLKNLLTGKQLLPDDVPHSLEELYAHYENGFLIFRKGLILEKKKARCRRCGNSDPRLFASYPCFRCGEKCLYCRKCLMMGRISACTPLISWREEGDGGLVENGRSPQTGRSSGMGPLLQKPSSVSETSHLFESKSAFYESVSSFSKMQPSSSGNQLSVLETQPSASETGPSKNHLDIGNQPSRSENHPSFEKRASPSQKQPSAPENRLSYSEDKPSGSHDLSPVSLVWDGTLSPGQKAASDKVVEAIAANDELLVWAVCGAGKTEVLFAGIERALKDGKRVCIATPRTDVVLELTPRLKKVFPGIKVASLYGGSEDRHLNAPLTLSTTHQLLRFYKAFDTVILDEVDAFPYTVEEALQHAVRKARKDESAMIYLTATPNRTWQRECRAGKRAYVTIPARYHRHPLPVPRPVWCGNWQKLLGKNKLPANVLKWLNERIAAQKQVLLFVPKIAVLEKILPILRRLHPDIEAVHAEDPDRKEKVHRMRDKKLLMLVTTTILERGVTFPNIDVAVLGAEDRIFTESALVQIAGRAGRSARYPKGDVVFFHYGRTEAMNKARKQILAMNKEAAEKGLIDPEE